MSYGKVAVLENRRIAGGIHSILVPWDNPVQPGQFFMLRRPEAATLLPRAISVCDWDGARLRFLVQTVGRGTGELSGLREGDALCLTGPLGNGFPVEELTGRVALVGGGIGVAPLLYTAKKLRERGIAVDILAGYRDELFLTGELEQAGDHLLVSTESGSFGQKGFVTVLLRPKQYDTVLVCGPEPMMKAVVGLCMESATPVYISMENKMACGLGACLVCTCTDRLGKNRRTCKDGPVFRGEEINFDA